MGNLIYAAIASLDGYIADADGNFDWAAPDEAVHAYVNDLERPIGTYLYGRRMYETMSVWETMDVSDEPDVMQDYAAIWRAAAKVVFSSTLTEVSSSRTRIESAFDPEAIREMKRAATEDISIGGPLIASHAFAAGLIDEFHLFVCPIIIGAGNPSLPDHLRLELELLDEHRFGNGTLHLHYRVAS